jgi:hypothetical protein
MTAFLYHAADDPNGALFNYANQRREDAEQLSRRKISKSHRKYSPPKVYEPQSCLISLVVLAKTGEEKSTCLGETEECTN